MTCYTTSSFAESVSNTSRQVGDWSGEEGLVLISITTTAAVRVTLKWYVGDRFEDEITFDVLGAERVVVPATRVVMSAYTHVSGATGTVRWVVCPTSAYVPTVVQLHHELPAGVYNGASDSRLVPPAHATGVRVDRELTGTFTLTLYDPTSTLLSEQDQSTMPNTGVKTGRTSRLTLTTSAGVRLSYDLGL